MSDPMLRALDELVPAAPHETGDWAGVLAAAGVKPRRARRPSRRQLIAAVAALAVLGTLVATPALGVRGLILGLIGRTNVSFVSSPGAPAKIKLEFLELDQGAPAGMAQHPLPDEARSITFRGAGGQKHVLWVAPTRSGGFCSIGVASGGCLAKDERAQAGPVTIGGGFSEARGQAPVVREVDGVVLSPSVATLTLEFADGKSIPLPFVYVSSPIDAGFYFYGVPAPHQSAGHRPVAVVARDAAGTVVATKRLDTFHPAAGSSARPSPFVPGRPPQRLPAGGTVHPTAPLRRATASGVTAVAGSNGAVQITAGTLPPAIDNLLGRSVTYDCFRLAHPYGIATVFGEGQSGAFTRSVGFTVRGNGGPLDGCEIDSSRGHRWPDALGSHSPVELAFTAKGRAYFADRAAARDLALFVRSGRMQRIRRERGKGSFLRDMNAAYGHALAGSQISASRSTNTESPSRRRASPGRSSPIVVRNGRIVRSNLAPYAKVF